MHKSTKKHHTKTFKRHNQKTRTSAVDSEFVCTGDKRANRLKILLYVISNHALSLTKNLVPARSCEARENSQRCCSACDSETNAGISTQGETFHRPSYCVDDWTIGHDRRLMKGLTYEK
jgi:hypothetical protein